jgi:hypothetical protein
MEEAALPQVAGIVGGGIVLPGWPEAGAMADFTMPALGADMETGKVVEWLVKPGDRVSPATSWRWSRRTRARSTSSVSSTA